MPAQNRAIGSPSRCRLIFRLMKILSPILDADGTHRKMWFLLWWDFITLEYHNIYQISLHVRAWSFFQTPHRRNPANVKLSAPKCKSFGCVTYRPSSSRILCAVACGMNFSPFILRMSGPRRRRPTRPICWSVKISGKLDSSLAGKDY